MEVIVKDVKETLAEFFFDASIAFSWSPSQDVRCSLRFAFARSTCPESSNAGVPEAFPAQRTSTALLNRTVAN